MQYSFGRTVKTRYMEKIIPDHHRKSKMERKCMKWKRSLNTDAEDGVTNTMSSGQVTQSPKLRGNPNKALQGHLTCWQLINNKTNSDKHIHEYNVCNPPKSQINPLPHEKKESHRKH